MMPGDSEEAMVGYKIREGRRIVGFALNNYPDPEQAYVKFEKPRPSLLAQTAANRISLEYAMSTGEISGAQDVLTYGFIDVARLIIPALARHPSIPKERALEIATSHGTLMAQAIGARMSAEDNASIIFDRPGKAFEISADRTHIEIIDDSIRPNPHQGCPVVHMKNGEIEKIEPVFERFSAWAGHLAVIAHFEHRG